MKGNVQFNFYLPPKMLEKLRKKAQKQGVSVSGLLRVLIARECEEKK